MSRDVKDTATDFIAGAVAGMLALLALWGLIDWEKAPWEKKRVDSSECQLEGADINSNGRPFELHCGSKAYRIKIEEIGVRS